MVEKLFLVQQTIYKTMSPLPIFGSRSGRNPSTCLMRCYYYVVNSSVIFVVLAILPEAVRKTVPRFSCINKQPSTPWNGGEEEMGLNEDSLSDPGRHKGCISFLVCNHCDIIRNTSS